MVSPIGTAEEATLSVRVLLVAESPGLAEEVNTAFKATEIDLYIARDHLEVVLFLDREPCDVLLLEVVKEGAEGLALCRVVRQSWDVGILFLLQPRARQDVILGYEMGADGYVTVPFVGRELVARVEALARRVNLGGRATGPAARPAPAPGRGIL